MRFNLIKFKQPLIIIILIIFPSVTFLSLEGCEKSPSNHEALTPASDKPADKSAYHINSSLNADENSAQQVSKTFNNTNTDTN